MATKEKNIMLVTKEDGFLYVIKPYTSVHNVDGAVQSVNGIKPIDGNINFDVITRQDVVELFA